MGAGKKRETLKMKERTSASTSVNGSVTARNLGERKLEGVIFGCKHYTKAECLSKEIFGLPAPHISYVRYIVPGMPLFLLNYSDRQLYGIYEAASNGQMYINPHMWTSDDSKITPFPAQVRIRVRAQCQPLIEEQFRPILEKNYFSPSHFWFELDKVQVKNLLDLFSSTPVGNSTLPGRSICKVNLPKVVPTNIWKSAETSSDSFVSEWDFPVLVQANINIGPMDSGSCVDEEYGQLEKKQEDSNLKCHQMTDCLLELEATLGSPLQLSQESLIESFDDISLGPKELLYLIGGYNGTSWSLALDTYCPSRDIVKFLMPMTSPRSYCSAASINGDIYVFGGVNDKLWCDTVESFNFQKSEWTRRPPLAHKKGSLAGVSLHNRIFAIGGGNGVQCYSDVEMFDPFVGRWVNTQSMLQQRFSLAAAEINGVLYALGGFDGNNYLMSAERLDPRESSWVSIQNMKTRRGCHSVAVLNERLYALGGYDGEKMVSSVEVFDPRTSSWVMGDPMNRARGYAASAVIGNSLYAIGGLQGGDNIIDTVECFDGNSWQITDSKAVGKRSFFSALVL